MGATAKIFSFPLSRQSPVGLLVLLALGIFPLVSGNILYVEILILAVLYAIFAMSWDILTGYTHEVNFGFAFFIGGAGYLSGVLNSLFFFPPLMAIPLAALTAGMIGLLIGYLTLRLKGPYFAMVTLAFAGILYKLAFILYKITGGEEGISGLKSLTAGPVTDFYLIWTVTVGVYFLLIFYSRSKHGIILKAIRADEDVAQSSGINTAYYKIEAFAISGFLAGIGGGLYAHAQMHIGPTMLSGTISVLVVLLAMIGGMGTIVGPLLGAIFLSALNEILRAVEAYRIVIYTGLLIVFIYLAPEGFVNLPFVKRNPRAKRFLLGKEEYHEPSGSEKHF
ncbi:MAG: branched-chain amino acid ABC transporter permease [Deltaproteobacteria bacterium]|nr:branched-chain amino acid ABC transporter permease [Deltaproteobacteria bacterium]